MRIHPHPVHARGSYTVPAVALGMLLFTSGVSAQAPVSAPGGLPATSDAAIEQAYEDLDWTGRPLSPQTLRKEAGAALVEGRRNCAQRFTGADRKACLQTVQADYQSMLARLKMRTASRR